MKEIGIKRVVMCFTPHIKEWGIVYAISTYLVFILAYISIYGSSSAAEIASLAMIIIAVFWLCVIELFDYAKGRLDP